MIANAGGLCPGRRSARSVRVYTMASQHYGRLALRLGDARATLLK
jgi:hypothetical protein